MVQYAIICESRTIENLMGIGMANPIMKAIGIWPASTFVTLYVFMQQNDVLCGSIY